MKRVALVSLLLLGIASAYSLTDTLRVVKRVDYSMGVVFFERWRGDYYIGVERVVPLEDYLDFRLKESVVENWRSALKRSRQQEELAFDAKGLIPDIELPALPVFGEGSRIDISGQDRITLGGRQQSVSGGATSVEGAGWFPELKMEQQLGVKLDGTIGERAKVSIDHDSERREGQNKIKLTYEGTDDEIIKTVELGDTRLTIPSTGYTGDLPAHKGLFGISAQGKMAGVDLYAVASREQSQGQTKSWQGRRELSVDTLYGLRYIQRRFYYVEAPGTIRNLRVYVDDRNRTNNDASFVGIATVTPDEPDSLPDYDYDRASGDFDLKAERTDYILHGGGLIEFTRVLNSTDVVGVVVFTETDTIGGSTYNDSIVLKLLKPERPDTASLTWEYELKNVYALSDGDVQLDSIAIYLDDPAGSNDLDYEADTASANYGLKYTQILGLDPNGDGILEYPEFDGNNGFIRFPTAKPFASLELSTRDSIVYERDPNTLRGLEGRKYYIVAKYSSTTESYNLGQVDIKDGSAKVVVDGVEWVEGTDFQVDYPTGVLTFLRTLPTDADIQVTYEYDPWFQASQKSLVGARAEWVMSQNGKVGSSVFYRSEGTPEERPSLGNEPFRRMIAEADASYSLRSDGVSAFLDRLPLLRAQAPTTVTASVEGAVSLPDPNMRGVAYIDDFGTTTITRTVSTTATLWHNASVPVGRDTADFALAPVRWSNPDEKVRKDSVFGPDIGDEGRETEEVLRVVFAPDSGDLESWAGVATSPYRLGMNLEELENLEVILRSRHGSGRIHVTLATDLDEDAPRRSRSGAIVGYNGVFDTEDRNANGQLDREIEDSGLDTVFGADADWTAESADDGNDDYDADENPAGTEGDGRLNSEDLDLGGFSRFNHYYEAEVPLGETRYVTQLYNGWELYRIPLKDSAAFDSVGYPKWDDVRLVRIWLDGFEATDTVEFFSIEVVGSSWHDPEVGPRLDTTYLPVVDTTERVWVAQVSKKTDTSYVPPVEPKTDAQGLTEQEVSLLFGYENLRGDRQGVVSKVSAERDDFREYEDLRLYVHDDGNGLGFLLRLGADSLNYYEYRSLVTDGEVVPGRDGKWFEFVIRLDSFPGLKSERDSFAPGESSWTRGSYALRGLNPQLSDIRYTALGIENGGAERVSGGIWFDDLRLSSPNREPGYGFQARTDFALSDFVTVGLSFTYSDPNFRKFSEGRGIKPGGFGTTTGLSVRSYLDRLLPYGWGLELPLSYVLSRQQELPKFSSRYLDLRLSREQAAKEVAVGQSEDLAFDNVRKRLSGNRLLNYTVEAMALSWRQRRARHTAVLSRDSTRSTALQWTYSVAPDLKVGLSEDYDLYLFPQSIRFGTGGSDQWNVRGSRPAVADTWQVDTLETRGLTADLGVEYSPVEDLSFDYGFATERDRLVADPDSLWFMSIGSEAGREEEFGVTFAPDFVDFLSPSVGFDGDYSDERPKPDSDYARYRNIENGGDIDVSLALDLGELTEGLRSDEPDPKTDSTPAAGPGGLLVRGVGFLSDAVEPFDVDYSISRSSNMLGVYAPVPWHYQLGFSDTFGFDTFPEPSSVTRDLTHGLRLTSGVAVKAVRARLAYDWSQGRSASLYNTSIDRSQTWPDVDLSLDQVHNLFKSLATDSRLNSRYRQSTDLTGVLVDTGGIQYVDIYGRTGGVSHDLSPLLSWQTTWKKHVTTTLSANYTFGDQTTWRESEGDKSVTSTDTRSAELKVEYAFSAPQGLKLPFLRTFRFSSDLRLTWQLQLARGQGSRTNWTQGFADDPVPTKEDNSWSTRLAASYRFSRSVEAGLNTGYSSTRSGITGYANRTTDLDIWVLFRF